MTCFLKAICAVSLLSVSRGVSLVSLGRVPSVRNPQRQGTAVFSEIIFSSYGHWLGCSAELNQPVTLPVTSLTAVTEIHDERDLRKEGFALVHSPRVQPN